MAKAPDQDVAADLGGRDGPGCDVAQSEPLMLKLPMQTEGLDSRMGTLAEKVAC